MDSDETVMLEDGTVTSSKRRDAWLYNQGRDFRSPAPGAEEDP